MTVATVRLPATDPDVRLARARFAASNAASESFFAANGDAVAHACRAMAERFQAGARLRVYGEGARCSDVAHVVVEFMHPVIVGKRALPAVALVASGGQGRRSTPLDRLGTVGRSGDMLMVMTDGSPGESDRAMLAHAAAAGLLTLTLIGGTSEDERRLPAPHLTFAVPSNDACIVQETHEMLYHVLWELVHVFLEHRAVRA